MLTVDCSLVSFGLHIQFSIRRSKISDCRKNAELVHSYGRRETFTFIVDGLIELLIMIPCIYMKSCVAFCGAIFG